MKCKLLGKCIAQHDIALLFVLLKWQFKLWLFSCSVKKKTLLKSLKGDKIVNGKLFTKEHIILGFAYY